MPERHIPTIVLGGSGYVAGECVRLALQHPNFQIQAVAALNSVGQKVCDVFPHLSPLAGELAFDGLSDAFAKVDTSRPFAVFAALPSGDTGPILNDLLNLAGKNAKIVDLSPDNRYPSAARYEEAYKTPHPAPEQLRLFTCELPDLACEIPAGQVAHPGCFTTCVTLAIAPLLGQGLIEPSIVASGVTGSTGSGRTPKTGTHHPERHGGMWAYELLSHRHLPEMKFLLAPYADGSEIDLTFLPHSGSFARGIHATITARLKVDVSADEAVSQINRFYSHSPFIHADTAMHNVKEVVGTNNCRLGVAVQDGRIAVVSVIDNLVKGAAGGAVHWMNRLFHLEQDAGLTSPALGWT